MVKVHKLVAAIATALSFSTTGAYALNMGEISWKSAYGQPLNATIELSGTAGLTAKDIQASLASNAEFTNAGITHSNELAKLSFTTVMGKGGKAYIKITSHQPIKEPYLDILVNVSFQGTKLSKDYTILLDLPATNNKISVTNQPISQATHTPDKSNTVANEDRQESSDSYQIKKGETLWIIAEKLHGSSNTAKTAAAIYKKNPNAFINGSINHLIAGYNLKVPSAKEIRAISITEANNLFSPTKSTTQNTKDTVNKPAVTDKKQAAQLENKLKTSEQKLNSARLENDELSTKIEQLQNEIDKLKKVSDIKDEQIKSIKSQQTTTDQQANTASTSPVAETTTDEASPKTETSLADTTVKPDTTSTEATATVDTAPTDTVPNTVTDTTAKAETTPTNSAPNATTAATDTTSQPETTPVNTAPNATTTSANTTSQSEATSQPKAAPTAKSAPKTDKEDNSLLLGLDSSTLMQVGGGILLVICIAFLILRRKKASEPATEVDLSHVTLDDSEDHKALEHIPDHFTTLTATDDKDSNPITNLENETSLLDKVEIYVAYDRYDEAISLLSEALKTDPNNDEYRLKLLTIYAEQGDSKNFDKAAQELLLHSPLAQAKVDKLRADYPALASHTQPESVKEHSEPTISDDFGITYSPKSQSTSHVVESSVHDTPTLTEKPTKQPEKYDSTPSTSGTNTETANADSTSLNLKTSSEIEDALTKSNADFALETVNPEFAIEEKPLFGVDSSEFDDSFKKSDSPIVEFDDKKPETEDEPKEESFKFDLGLEDDLSENKTHSEEKTGNAVEETTNAGVNFADLSSTPTSSTANLTDHSDEIIEKDQVTTKLELVHAYLEMNDTEGAQDLLNEVIQEGSAAQKAEAQKILATLKNNVTTPEEATPQAQSPFATTSIEQPLIIEPQPNLNKEQKIQPTSTSTPSLATKDTSDTIASPANDEAANVSDSTELDLGFELSAEDEVATKLELAHAYIDMGDKSGAKDLLDEVAKEGNSQQKKEAEQLMASLN